MKARGIHHPKLHRYQSVSGLVARPARAWSHTRLSVTPTSGGGTEMAPAPLSHSTGHCMGSVARLPRFALITNQRLRFMQACRKDTIDGASSRRWMRKFVNEGDKGRAAPGQHRWRRRFKGCAIESRIVEGRLPSLSG